MNKILQEVGGRRIEGSLSDFEHKAKVYLTIESEKINCDTRLRPFDFRESTKILGELPSTNNDTE